MTLFKFINKKTHFLLAFILFLFITTGVVLFLSAKREAVFWKTYKNSELGYEIQYPSNWYVKEEYQSSFRSQCAKDDICLEKLYIVNRKEKVLVGDESLTKNGSAFCIRIFGVDSDISSIKEWVEESIKKASWSDKVKQEVKQRELDSITTMKIGGIKRKTWVESGSARVRLQWVHEGRLYGISYMSGSQKQFKKDLNTFGKMLASFRILE